MVTFWWVMLLIGSEPLTPPYHPTPFCVEWGWKQMPGLPWYIQLCLRWSK